MGEANVTTRRMLLKRGALVLIGALAMLGLKQASTHAAVTSPPMSPSKTPLRLYGRHWHLYSPARKRGDLMMRGDQAVVYGELMTNPTGAKAGEFCANCVFLQHPAGGGPFLTAAVELHSFNLEDGTLMGMGTTRTQGELESLYTVVGGTGRYAGIRGTYKARQNPQEFGGDGTAEFVFDLTLADQMR